MTRPRLVRWGDTTRYLTCRAAGCIQGVIPSVCVLCFSVARFLVYFSLCEETSKNTVCWIITEYRLTDYSNKGVTFYLVFSVAGLIFCVVNSLINLLLFCNQSKGILGSWFTWVFLCSVGHIVWSFQQSLSGPVSWLSGGYPGVLSVYLGISLFCWTHCLVFSTEPVWASVLVVWRLPWCFERLPGYFSVLLDTLSGLFNRACLGQCPGCLE